MTKQKLTDKKVVTTSTLVSISDVTFNFIISLVTGSTVMLSQALQGLSDVITGLILYIGVRRAQKQPDYKYQFGYGRELFFWVLVAGIIMFFGTGSASVYFGYQQFTNPSQIEHVSLAFGMLIFGFITNGYALSLSIARIRQQGVSKKWWSQLLRSSIVETKATFIIDCLGVISTIFGFGALLMFIATNNPQFDGIGSMIIGLTMMGAAVILIKDVRDLIVGKSVDPETADRIKRVTHHISGVNEVLDLRTMYLGSAQLFVILEVHIEDGHTTDTIEKIIDEIKAKVQKEIPLVEHIQVEVETPEIA